MTFALSIHFQNIILHNISLVGIDVRFGVLEGVLQVPKAIMRGMKVMYLCVLCDARLEKANGNKKPTATTNAKHRQRKYD